MDGGGVELGALASEDLEEVCAIERTSFGTPWSRALFEAELQRPELCFWRVLRTETSPRVVAYGGFWKAVDEAHFTNIAVRAERRRQGLGRRLLKALLDCAREQACVRATLEVRPSNLGALTLYRLEGFEPVAVRPRYYSDDGEDALILWKQSL
ncbi:MAG: ribosomal protein S18-alanine N-acetyltransferase [bacterium]